MAAPALVAVSERISLEQGFYWAGEELGGKGLACVQSREIQGLISKDDTQRHTHTHTNHQAGRVSKGYQDPAYRPTSPELG